MDQYFPVIPKASSLHKGSEEKVERRAEVKYQPYARQGNKLSRFGEQMRESDTRASSSALTKFVLGTLSDPSNPITHSDVGDRSDRVFSSATGHQVSEAQRVRKLHQEDREHKLLAQRGYVNKPKGGDSLPLSNIRVYINGFLENTTDIEMKRTIIRAGGQVVPTASGCTHILTSQQLSGSKTHKLLTTKSRIKVHVVKPEWVMDSIAAGKRQPEREYDIVKSSSAKTLDDMFRK